MFTDCFQCAGNRLIWFKTVGSTTRMCLGFKLESRVPTPLRHPTNMTRNLPELRARPHLRGAQVETRGLGPGCAPWNMNVSSTPAAPLSFRSGLSWRLTSTDLEEAPTSGLSDHANAISKPANIDIITLDILPLFQRSRQWRRFSCFYQHRKPNNCKEEEAFPSKQDVTPSQSDAPKVPVCTGKCLFTESVQRIPQIEVGEVHSPKKTVRLHPSAGGHVTIS